MGNWFHGSEQIASSMVRGNVRESFHRALAWSRCERRPVYRLLWTAFRSTWGLTGSDRSGTGGAVAHCSFTSDFRDRIEQMQRDEREERGRRHAILQIPNRAQALVQVLLSRRLQSPAALRDISYTHPFVHRPLVEFMFRIPSDIVYRPGEPRRLMRRALAGILPDLVLRRRSKASYGTTFRSSILPLATELLNAPRMCLAEGDGLSHKASDVG
jgi:hypothetical protein